MSAYRATVLPWHRNKRSRGPRELETRSPNIFKQSAPVGAHIPSARYSVTANCRAATLSSKSRGTATTSRHGNPETLSQRRQYRATSRDTGANLTVLSHAPVVPAQQLRHQWRELNTSHRSPQPKATRTRRAPTARQPSTSTGLTHKADPIPVSLPMN